MIDKNIEKLASQLSYEIIKEVEPNELDLFDDIKEEYLKNPDAFLEKDLKKKEKMLGFGGGVGEVFITMKVLPLIWGVVSYIGMEGIESIKKAIAKKVDITVEEKIMGKKELLSNEKIMEIRDYTIKNAITIGIDKEKAGIIADSLIGRLILM